MEALMGVDVCNNAIQSTEPRYRSAKNSESNSFKNVMNKNSQQNASEKNIDAANKENFHEMVNAVKSKTETSSEEEQENDLVMALDDMAAEIVDILEGFGLLNEHGEIKLNEETLDYIFSAIDKDGLNKGEKMNNLVFGELTGTYEVDQNEATQQIKELVSKYLSSLENSSDNGKNVTGNGNAAMMDLTREAGEQSNKTEAVEVDFNKLTGMLKQAVKNATGDNQAGQNESGQNNADINSNKNTTGQNNTDVNSNKNGTGQNKTDLNSNETENVQFDQQINSQVSQAKSETVNFAEKLTEQVELTQNDVSDNVTKIIDKISVNLTDGKSEFDIDLKPEFLGKVSVKLISEQGEMKAIIKAGTTEARAMIADQLSMLNDSLKVKGLNVSSIEVVYDSANFDTSSDQFFNQQDGSSKRKGYSAKRASKNTIESVTYDILPEIDIPDVSVRNSSVEFSA